MQLPLRCRIILAVGMLLLAVQYAPEAGARDWIYSARPGDNVWSITEKHLKSLRYWKRLQEYNQLQTPDRILPGTRLRIPISWLKVQPASAHVVVVQGEVHVIAGNDGVEQPAVVGLALRSGDGIRTGTRSSATVQFADRSLLLLQADTALTMDSMSAYGTTGMVDTSMRLHNGRVENEVEPASGEASRYRIITPSAVVAVRGTSFRSAFDEGSGVALGEVTEGALAVGAGGGEQRVASGFGIRAERGLPLGAPVALLPAPDLDGLPRQATQVAIALAWPPLPTASGYRVQLFPAGDFTRLLRDVEVDAPGVELDAPPDGEYVLRVRGIDPSGLEGLNGDRTLLIDARPVAPALLGPAADAFIAGTLSELWWSVPEDAAGFHLQIARDAAFSDLMLDRALSQQSRYVPTEAPAPGAYHWRVASVAADGERGPFSPPRQFTIQAVPTAVAASGKVADGNVVIAWGRAANATRYEFQLARDAAFNAGLVERSVAASEIALPVTDAGEYFYRVRGISAEGVAGPYGPVNRLDVPGKPLSPAWLLLLAPLLLLL